MFVASIFEDHTWWLFMIIKSQRFPVFYLKIKVDVIWKNYYEANVDLQSDFGTDIEVSCITN